MPKKYVKMKKIEFSARAPARRRNGGRYRMICPKCGGEIPFYDLKPNCKHCGVNIMYYTQEEGLARDAKRTELESAVARMVIARVKAAFIGSKLAIARMIAVVASVAALAVPFAGVKYTLPFFTKGFSAGLVGIILAFTNGMGMKLPQFLTSSLLAKGTLAAAVPTGCLVVLALVDVAIFAALLLSFLNLTKTAEFMKKASVAGFVLAIISQAVVFVMKFTTPDTETAHVSLGFGALVAAAVYVVIYLINRAMLNKGIEPEYKENDLKRRDLLKKVRAGEVDIDTLPLPVFESEEERENRMKQLEEALIAEEEGKEQ